MKLRSQNNIDSVQEFQKEAFSQNDKFSVFVAKDQSPNDPLIQRELQLMASKSQGPFYKPQPKGYQVEIYEQPSPIIQNLSQDFEKQKSSQPQLHQIYDSTTSNIVSPRVNRVNFYSPKNQIKHHRQNTPKLQQTSTFPSKNVFILNKSKQGFPSSSELAKKEKQMQELRESLYFDEKTKSIPKSTVKNHIIEDIVRDGDLFIRNTNLLDSIYKLKQLNLLKHHDMGVNRFPGIGKVQFVFNDYHAKSTNNGYSRNFGGVFYTR